MRACSLAPRVALCLCLFVEGGGRGALQGRWSCMPGRKLLGCLNCFRIQSISEQKQAPGANDLCVCMCVVVWWDGSRERLLSALL